MSSDPQDLDPQQQEQMRQYVEQLRSAEPAEILAQAFTMLGTGAEVKLGRPDARVLIDAIAALVDAIDGRVPQQLLDGMRNGLVQLQQAQVQAESEAGAEQQPSAPQEPATPPQDSAPPGEAGQGGGPGTPGGQGAAGSGSAGQSQSGRMTDRLWVPGRGQPPQAG